MFGFGMFPIQSLTLPSSHLQPPPELSLPPQFQRAKLAKDRPPSRSALTQPNTGDAQENYNQLNEGKHEAKFSHELLAGGASFMAFKAFEDHQRKEGKQVNHAFAKELLAGFVGGEVDKLIETKGADFIDREEAKRKAQRNVEEMYDSHYGNQEQYDPNQSAPGHIEDSFGKY